MSFLDRLLGRRPEPRRDSPPRAGARGFGSAGDTSTPGQLTDEQAVERYRYLLRTAPPEAIEEAHAEAFAQLTPDQRRLVLDELGRDLPPGERSASDDPRSLARMATRAELRRPGTMERTFGGMNPGGVGMGGFMAGSFLSTIAGVVVGTAVADAIFNDSGFDGGNQDGAEATEGDMGTDTADGGYDSGDAGGDFGGGDFGGGGFGGDFGGGDFGGGDF
jgi:hypothetical protein